MSAAEKDGGGASGLPHPPPSMRLLLTAGVAAMAWIIAAWFLVENYYAREAADTMRQENLRTQQTAESITLGVQRNLARLHGISYHLAKAESIRQALKRLGPGVVPSSLAPEERAVIWTADPALHMIDRFLADSVTDLGGMSAVWVMNAAGDCIAASNADQAGSFVGTSYADREYFRETKAGRPGHQFAMGRNSNVPGLYFAAPVVVDGRFVGTVAGKIVMPVLSFWANQADTFITDQYGVVILARRKALEMRALPHAAIRQLDVRERLARYKQEDFAEIAIAPWGDSRYPELQRLEHETSPLLMISHALPEDKVTVTVMQPLPQLAAFDQQRDAQFILVALIGTLSIGGLAAGLFSLRNSQYARQRRWSEEILRESEAALNHAQEIAHVGSWSVKLASGEVFWSPETHRMFGLPAQRRVTLDLFFEHVHPEDRERVRRNWEDSLARGAFSPVEHRTVGDGTVKWVRALAEFQLDATGRPKSAMGTCQDVTAQHEYEAHLLASEQRFRSLFSNMTEGVALHELVLDSAARPANYRVIDCNPQFERFLGVQREAVQGKLATDAYGFPEPPYLREYSGVVLSGEGLRFEAYFQPVDKYFDISVVPWEQRGFATILADITERKRADERLKRIAHYDALTQLPNRTLLADRLQLALARTHRAMNLLAVCYLDLDNFKAVNDAYGHEIGDRLLVEVVGRLKGCLRGDDTLARMGGDEFIVLLGGLRDFQECEHALDRILQTVAAPYRIDETQIRTTASVGITLFPLDSSDAEVLLRHADQAMYVAKQDGRNRYHLFDLEHDARMAAHRELQGRIKAALDAGEFRLYYQPKVNLRTGRVIGAEALIRWQHPERGVLAPGEFLPAIENTQLSSQLDDWVLAEALRQMEAWHQSGLTLAVSVNVSGRRLQQADFSRCLAELLARHPGIKSHSFEIEVLETAALEDMATVSRVIEECQRLGVSFALDDFGTGYSSLTYLKRLPVNTLKVDQSFVRDMLDDPEDLAIVEGVIGLAEAFERQLVAEGVETPEHGLMLLQLGCELAQGYGVARPMPAEAMPGWVAAYQPQHPCGILSCARWSKEDLPLIGVGVNHRHWVAKIASMVEASAGDDVHPPALDPHQCRFGLWYEGIGQARYGHMAQFRALYAIHQEIHALGQTMVTAHGSGRTAEARGRLEELFGLRDRMLEQLHALQAMVLQDASPGAGEYSRPMVAPPGDGDGKYGEARIASLCQ